MTTTTESQSDKSLGFGGCRLVMWKYCHFIDRLECTGFCYSGRVFVGEVLRMARDECIFGSRLVRLTTAGIDYGSLCTGHPSSQRLIQWALCGRHLSLTCSVDDRYLKWKHMGEERGGPNVLHVHWAGRTGKGWRRLVGSAELREKGGQSLILEHSLYKCFRSSG